MKGASYLLDQQDECRGIATSKSKGVESASENVHDGEAESHASLPRIVTAVIGLVTSPTTMEMSHSVASDRVSAAQGERGRNVRLRTKGLSK